MTNETIDVEKMADVYDEETENEQEQDQFLKRDQQNEPIGMKTVNIDDVVQQIPKVADESPPSRLLSRDDTFKSLHDQLTVQSPQAHALAYCLNKKMFKHCSWSGDGTRVNMINEEKWDAEDIKFINSVLPKHRHVTSAARLFESLKIKWGFFKIDRNKNHNTVETIWCAPTFRRNAHLNHIEQRKTDDLEIAIANKRYEQECRKAGLEPDQPSPTPTPTPTRTEDPKDWWHEPKSPTPAPKHQEDETEPAPTRAKRARDESSPPKRRPSKRARTASAASTADETIIDELMKNERGKVKTIVADLTKFFDEQTDQTKHALFLISRKWFRNEINVDVDVDVVVNE